jgi:hypothetical protein
VTHIAAPMFYRNALAAEAAQGELSPASFYGLLDQVPEHVILVLRYFNSLP